MPVTLVLAVVPVGQFSMQNLGEVSVQVNRHIDSIHAASADPTAKPLLFRNMRNSKRIIAGEI